MDSSVIPTSDRVHTHTIRICLYIYWNSRLWYSLLMLHSLIFYRFTMLFPKFSFFFCRKKNLLHFYFPPVFLFCTSYPSFLPSSVQSFFFFVHLIYSKRNCNEKEKTKTKTKMNSAKNHNQNNKKKKNRDLLGESRKIKQK